MKLEQEDTLKMLGELRGLITSFDGISSYERDKALTLICNLHVNIGRVLARARPCDEVQSGLFQWSGSGSESGDVFQSPSLQKLETFQTPSKLFQPEELNKYDIFSLGIHGSKTISVCFLWIFIGFMAPSVLSERRINLIGRTIFILGHLVAYFCYRRVIWRVDNSYTSYRGSNDYGYTNVEKAEIRAEVTRVWRLLIFRAIIAAFLHHHFLPLVITSTLGYGTLLNNQHYVDIFWNPNKLKKPQGFIPRSVSGRLL